MYISPVYRSRIGIAGAINVARLLLLLLLLLLSRSLVFSSDRSLDLDVRFELDGGVDIVSGVDRLVSGVDLPKSVVAVVVDLFL